jgi:arylsulfatase A-like enzyme
MRSKMASIVRTGVATFVTCLFLMVTAVAEETPVRPNIVLILADDLGYKDVGYRKAEIKTPHIDSIAASGVRLEQFYAMPLCSPTRACLMTGRYPMRQGLQRLVVYPWSQFGLPQNERTLPQALKEAGYSTHISGKWHLGHHQRAYLPMARGFDEQYGLYNGAMFYFTHKIDGGLDWHRNQQPLVEAGYSTDLIGAEAVRMIEQRDSSKPMFLYVPFNAPHAPLQVPKKYLDMYPAITDVTRKTFAAMVTCMDDQIGKIKAELTKQGIASNTIIIFMSDNGGPLNSGASNGKLRGGKGLLYDGGMKVPCAVSWPGKIPAGVNCQETLHCADWYPTLLKLAGASVEQPLKIDGLDIWPVLAEGKPTPHAEILHNVTPNSGAIRVGDFKLVVNASQVLKDAKLYGKLSSRDPNVVQGPEVVELFNVRVDPIESINLAAQQPAKVAELRAKLDAYAREQVEPLIQPEPENFPYPEVWEPAE